MKIYAEFGCIEDGEFVKACGDRSVIRIDARVSIDEIHYIARRECADRHFPSYQLVGGDRYLDAAPISHPESVK